MCAVGRVVGADTGIAEDAFGHPCNGEPAYRMIVPMEIGLIATWVALMICRRHGKDLHKRHPANVTPLEDQP